MKQRLLNMPTCPEISKKQGIFLCFEEYSRLPYFLFHFVLILWLLIHSYNTWLAFQILLEIKHNVYKLIIIDFGFQYWLLLILIWLLLKELYILLSINKRKTKLPMLYYSKDSKNPTYPYFHSLKSLLSE